MNLEKIGLMRFFSCMGRRAAIPENIERARKIDAARPEKIFYLKKFKESNLNFAKIFFKNYYYSGSIP